MTTATTERQPVCGLPFRRGQQVRATVAIHDPARGVMVAVIPLEYHEDMEPLMASQGFAVPAKYRGPGFYGSVAEDERGHVWVFEEKDGPNGVTAYFGVGETPRAAMSGAESGPATEGGEATPLVVIALPRVGGRPRDRGPAALFLTT